MPHIVHQRQRFRQVLIQSENTRGRARDLRDLDRMCQPVAEVESEMPEAKTCVLFSSRRKALV